MSFKKGEYVQYALNGVCVIDDIKKINIDRSKNPKEFYVLKPVSAYTSTIYVPVENGELVSKMRHLLSKEDANTLIDSLKQDKTEWIEDRKERNNFFNNIIKEANPKELLKLVGCIYIQKQKLLNAGKKLSGTDEKQLVQAESIIKNELSFVLNLENKGIESYIKSRIKE